MNATTKDLNLVLQAMRNLPEATTFDMTKWRGRPEPDVTNCKMAACAIGCFCLKHPKDDLVLCVEIGSVVVLRSRCFCRGYEAVAARFDIELGVATALFSLRLADRDNTRERVYARLATFLKRAGLLTEPETLA